MSSTVVDETWPDGTPKKDHVEDDDGKVTERREYDKKGKKTKKIEYDRKGREAKETEYEGDGVTVKKTTEIEYRSNDTKEKTTEKEYVNRKKSKETETNYDSDEREKTKKEKEYEDDGVTVKKEKVTKTKYKKKGTKKWKETVETEIEYEKGKKKLKTVTKTKFCPEPNSERIRIKQVIKYQWTGQRWKEILPRAPPERFNCETGEPISYHPSGKTKNRYVAFLAAAIIFSVLGYTSQNNLFYLLGVGSLLIALVIYMQGSSEEDVIPIYTEIPVEEAKALEKIDILLKNADKSKESGELSAEKAELLKALDLSTEYGFIEKTKLIKKKLDDLARREKELDGT